MKDHGDKKQLLRLPEQWLERLGIGLVKFTYTGQETSHQEKFRIKWVNPKGRALLGISAASSSLGLQDLPDLFENEFPFKIEENLLRARESQEKIIAECYRKISFRKFTIIITSHEAEMLMLVSELPYQDKEEDEVPDDTTKKKTEGSLRKENIKLKKNLKLLSEQYDLLAETSPLPIFIHSSGKVLYANPASLKAFRANSEDDLIHKNIWELVDEEFHKTAVERTQKDESNKTPVTEKEEIFYRFDDTTMNVLVESIPVIYHGKSAVKITFRDITEQKKARQEKALIEKRFEHFMENLPAVVIIKNAALDIIYFNQYFKEHFAFHSSGEKEIREEDFMLENKENIRAIDNTALQAGKSVSFNKMKDRSGNTRVFRSIRFRIPFDENNEKAYLGVISWDITRQYNTEKRIRQSEENYRIINQNISDIIYSLDKELKITFVSGAVEQIFNIAANELTGRKVEALLPINTKLLQCKNDYLQKLKEAIRSGREHVTYQFCLDDQSNVKYLEINERIRYDEDGNYTGAIGTIRDITHRAKAEMQLKESNQKLQTSKQRYESLIQSLGEGIVILAGDASIILTNKAAQKILGASDDILKTKKFTDFLNNKYHKTLKQMFAEVQTQQRASEEFELIRYSSKIRYALITFTLIPSEMGHKSHILGVIRDITYRKYAEMQLRESKSQIEESNKLKSLFLQNISHEVRTPINAIVGFTDLLNRKDLKESKREEFLSIIKHSTQRLLRVITDIIDNSKLQANETTAHYTPENIYTLVREVHETYREEYSDTIGDAVEFNVNIPELIHPECKVDANKIKRIIGILLDNAFKFTDSGYIQLIVRDTEEDDQYFFIFEVKDTGIGIAKEKQQRIFEPFLQAADEGLNRVYGGTGLGLSTAKGLAKVMGGNIEIQSKKNHGTTVTFFVPAYK